MARFKLAKVVTIRKDGFVVYLEDSLRLLFWRGVTNGFHRMVDNPVEAKIYNSHSTARAQQVALEGKFPGCELGVMAHSEAMH